MTIREVFQQEARRVLEHLLQAEYGRIVREARAEVAEARRENLASLAELEVILEEFEARHEFVFEVNPQDPLLN